MTSVIAIAKVSLVTFLHLRFDFYFALARHSRHILLGSLLTVQVYSPLKLKFFPLITYFRTEYCTLDGTHSMVQTTNCFMAMFQTPSLGAEWGLGMQD